MRRLMLVAVAGATLSIAPPAASGPSRIDAEPHGRIVYSERFWPKDSRIVDNWELFVGEIGGQGSLRLTRNPRCDEVSPSWSRDGRWIAFACGWGPSAGIYVMRGDGSRRRNVTRLPSGRITGVAWAPDESRIAFGTKTGIWVVGADGKDRRRLTRGRHSWPTWSRDGRMIAYEHGSDLYLMRADGTGRRRLAKRAFTPAWSPDGRRIAFLKGEPYAIWLMNADGSRQRRLPGRRSDGVSITAGLAWSPDSRFLAYDSGSGAATGVYVSPVDGGSRRRVASGMELLGLAWGPSSG